MNRTLLIALFALSCSHARPRDMTAEEHRAEARAHEEAARKEGEQFNPGLTVRAPVRGPFADPGTEVADAYNPTAEHLATADREMRKAADHLAAARKLEQFESAACRDLAPEARSACPLLASWVTQVRNTKTGVELVLAARVDAVDTQRRLECHLAYAEANGFAKPSCPLFVKGMTIRLRDNSVLVLAGDTAAVAKELQDQARRIFAPPSTSPAVSTYP